MAIAYINGQITRTPYFKEGDSTPFAAVTVRESYNDRQGNEKVSGYHDVVAFGEDAQRLALYDEGDSVSLKTSIRYRPDQRFVGKDDDERNPFVTQYVILEILGVQQTEEEDDPFAGA